MPLYAFGQNDISDGNGFMNVLTNVEWCALGLGPCWSREEWIALWSGFGGVLLAFLLGVVTQTLSERRRSRAALIFLETALRKSMSAMSHFDEEYRKFGSDEQIALGFGGLAHASGAISWASAHPEKFAPNFFLRLLLVKEDITDANELGPANFSGPNFQIDA